MNLLRISFREFIINDHGIYYKRIESLCIDLLLFLYGCNSGYSTAMSVGNYRRHIAW